MSYLHVLCVAAIFLSYHVSNVRLLMICNEFRSCNEAVSAKQSETSSRKRVSWMEECNCNDDCHAFGDCCLSLQNDLRSWSYLRVTVTQRFYFLALMKSKCPVEWRNEKVRHLCENIGFAEADDFLLSSDFGHYMSLENDEFLLWHVTSKLSKITYRNIYCALCNNDTEVEAWSQKLRCLQVDKREVNSKVECSQVSYPIPPEYFIQEKVKRKPYQTQTYGGCNIAWYKANIRKNVTQTIAIVKSCAKFYAPVAVQDNHAKKLIVFKNEFCAVCSGYRAEQIRCPVESASHFDVQNPPLHNEISAFDPNFYRGGRIPDTNETCQSGYIFDGFKKECRLILVEDENDEATATNVTTALLAVESTETSALHHQSSTKVEVMTNTLASEKKLSFSSNSKAIAINHLLKGLIMLNWHVILFFLLFSAY